MKLIIKIKPLYRFLKRIQRRLKGTQEDRRCLAKEDVDFLLTYAKKGGTFLEIGCAFGQTTRSLSKKGFVVAVDPFIEDERKQIMGEYFEDITLEFMKNIREKNVCFFPLKSEDAEVLWSKEINREFDFIFIDGLHTYEQVKKDYAWIKFLKKGGYVAFHDTNMPEINKFVEEKPMKELDFVDELKSIKVFRK